MTGNELTSPSKAFARNASRAASLRNFRSVELETVADSFCGRSWENGIADSKQIAKMPTSQAVAYFCRCFAKSLIGGLKSVLKKRNLSVSKNLGASYRQSLTNSAKSKPFVTC